MQSIFFSIWNIDKDEVTQFIEQVNSWPIASIPLKFTAEFSDTETFLDAKV